VNHCAMFIERRAPVVAQRSLKTKPTDFNVKTNQAALKFKFYNSVLVKWRFTYNPTKSLEQE